MQGETTLSHQPLSTALNDQRSANSRPCIGRGFGKVQPNRFGAPCARANTLFLTQFSRFLHR